MPEKIKREIVMPKGLIKASTYLAEGNPETNPQKYKEEAMKLTKFVEGLLSEGRVKFEQM